MEIWYNAYVRKGLSMKVTVGISAHHVHLTKEDLEILFGEGYELTVNRDINQPGQFASNEFVTIRTEKSEIAHIRILGPVRSYTQVELSKTDYIKLGLDAPIRESGEVEKSAKVTIIGPKGMIEREAGIIATRHIHVPVEDAEKLGLAGHDYVSVKVPGPKRLSVKTFCHHPPTGKRYPTEPHLRYWTVSGACRTTRGQPYICFTIWICLSAGLHRL